MITRISRGFVLAGALAVFLTPVPTGGVPSAVGPMQAETPIAELSSGGGASYLRTSVTATGNLYLESPKGAFLVYNEGYEFCTGGAGPAFAIDVPFSDTGEPLARGFRAATVTQPNPGTFPVTIKRTTSDGRLRLVQTWASPNTAEKEITVKMTVTNVGTTTVNALELIRTTEAVGETDLGFYRAGTTQDSVFQWWHENNPSTPTQGVVVTAADFGKAHATGLTTDSDLADECGAFPSDVDRLAAGGWARIQYALGDFAPGRSLTVKVTYGRL